MEMEMSNYMGRYVALHRYIPTYIPTYLYIGGPWVKSRVRYLFVG